jgi:hypothetical protein
VRQLYPPEDFFVFPPPAASELCSFCLWLKLACLQLAVALVCVDSHQS